MNSDAVQVLAQNGVSTLTNLLELGDHGLARIGLKKGPRIRILKITAAGMLPGEDPRVKVGDKNGKGECRTPVFCLL